MIEDRWLGWFAGAALLLVSGCAPEPRKVSCSNDAQCVAHGGRFRYCLEARCVECVGRAGCSDGKSCDDGACVSCVQDRGCPRGMVCREGSCISPP